MARGELGEREGQKKKEDGPDQGRSEVRAEVRRAKRERICRKAKRATQLDDV